MTSCERNSKRKTITDDSIVSKSKRTKSNVNTNADNSKASHKHEIVAKASSHNYKLLYRKGVEIISLSSFQSNMNLTDLNDDCLDKICKYLDCNDRINLQFASDRFSDLTGAYLEREEFQFDSFKKKFSLSQVESLLSQFGFRIKRLKWTNEVSCKDLLLKYCPNIEELDISSKKGTDFIYAELLIALKDKLKVLKVAYCRLTDKECSIISKLARLEFLDLQANVEITGKYLSNFRKLKYLNISSCRQFQPEIFSELCHNNCFESLGIKDCNLLNDQSLKILLETQSDCLRQLNISYLYPKADVTVLMKLKSLRNVKINSIFPDDVRNGHNVVIDELARLHGDNLESLELFLGRNHEISDTGLINILKFRNLKKLYIFTAPLEKEFVYKFSKSSPNLEDLVVNVRKEGSEINMMDILPRFKKLKRYLMLPFGTPRFFS